MVNIRTIRRIPDTCDCKFLYQYDNDLPLNQRTFSILSFESICPFHQAAVSGISDPQQLYNQAISQESSKKNISIQMLLDNAPNTVYDINTDGTRVFKKGIYASWTWSGTAPNRLLTILIHGITLTTNQRNAINAKLDERYGISNVVINNG